MFVLFVSMIVISFSLFRLIFLIFLKEDDTIQLSLLSEVDCEEQDQPLPGIGSVFLCLFCRYSLLLNYTI